MPEAPFCLMPFLHLHVDVRSSARPCCVSTAHLGSVSTQGIQAIWESRPLNKIREQFRQGQWPTTCKACQKAEASGAQSLRQETLQRYAAYQLAHSTTIQALPQPIYWDIRFSNQCQFRCRTCWHGYSSAWYSEARQLTRTAFPNALQRAFTGKAADLFWQEWLPMLAQSEELFLAGGEPLIMPEHARLLDELIARGYIHLHLRYHTNLAVLNYQQTHLPDRWALFRKVTLGLSLDARGPQAEYIRKGTHWPEIVRHLEHLRDQHPAIERFWVPTVSVLSLPGLIDMYQWLVDEEFIRLHQFSLNILQQPAFYSIKLLPFKEKARISDQIHTLVRMFDKKEAAGTATPDQVKYANEEWQRVGHVMQAGQWQSKWPQLLRETHLLDAIRGENASQVFNELFNSQADL